MCLLIAEEDPALGAFLARRLQQDGYETVLTSDGDAAMRLAGELTPELAILSLSLPGCDGMKVLGAIRSLPNTMPVVMLVKAQDSGARLRCFEAGIDQVIQKPVSLAELRACCRVLLRRQTSSHILRHGDMELDCVEHSVRRNGETVPLTNREYALLEFLMRHRGQAVSRAALLHGVWRRNTDPPANLVDLHINYLRNKLRELGAAPMIRTVRGVGYSIGLGA